MSALRFAHPGRETQLVEQRDPYWSLTPRQRKILDTVRSFNGNRSAAARDLGISDQAVQASIRIAVARGNRPPPSLFRGRDLQPRATKPEHCGRWMPQSQAPCARGAQHAGHCSSAVALDRRGRHAA